MAGLIGGGVLVPIGLRLTSIHQDHLKRKRGPFVSKPNCSPSCNAGRNKTFASFFDIRINHSLGASLKLACFAKRFDRICVAPNNPRKLVRQNALFLRRASSVTSN